MFSLLQKNFSLKSLNMEAASSSEIICSSLQGYTASSLRRLLFFARTGSHSGTVTDTSLMGYHAVFSGKEYVRVLLQYTVTILWAGIAHSSRQLR